MTVLEVPGASLYYEAHGSGPLMLMIPGANGVADGFRPVAQHLATHYTVALYDRRGFSRSRLDGPQDYTHRLETDADDARRLVEHLTDEPATILGTSSGAIVALEVLARHPAAVGTLVPFEPPAVRLLADGRRWLDFFADVYSHYRRSGIEPALNRFRNGAFSPPDREVMAHAPKNADNATYWFEHELRQYPAVDLDLATLGTDAARIRTAVGRDSRGWPCYDVGMELGAQFDTEVIELPGGHVGHISRPAEFAHQLTDALAHPNAERR